MAEGRPEPGRTWRRDGSGQYRRRSVRGARLDSLLGRALAGSAAARPAPGWIGTDPARSSACRAGFFSYQTNENRLIKWTAQVKFSQIHDVKLHQQDCTE